MSEEMTGQASPEVIEQPAATLENVAAPEVDTEATQGEETQAETKTFTQAELNEIIQKEKAKAEAKAERRALKAYRETLERFAPKQEPQNQNFEEGSTRSQADIDNYVEMMIARRENERKAESIYAEAQKLTGLDRNEINEIPFTQAIAGAVLNSDVAGKLLAYMATNPDEVERITLLPPARQAAEIGKLEIKLANPPAPKVSKAPDPIKPIGSANTSSSKDPSEMTDAEFNAWRRRQIAQRR